VTATLDFEKRSFKSVLDQAPPALYRFYENIMIDYCPHSPSTRTLAPIIHMIEFDLNGTNYSTP